MHGEITSYNIIEKTLCTDALILENSQPCDGFTEFCSLLEDLTYPYIFGVDKSTFSSK